MFELLVHEWCLRAGMRVVAVEPAVEGTGNRPDFLVEAAGGRFYLECVAARGESDVDAGARHRLEDVRNALDRVDSPDFVLGIETDGAPARPVRTAALVGRVERWLAELDHARVVADPDSVPPFDEEADGLWLRLRPIPRAASRGERGGRATGVLAEGPGEVTPWVAMRRAVLRKAGRYGQRGGLFIENLWASRPAGFVDFRIDSCRRDGEDLRRASRSSRCSGYHGTGPRRPAPSPTHADRERHFPGQRIFTFREGSIQELVDGGFQPVLDSALYPDRKGPGGGPPGQV